MSSGNCRATGANRARHSVDQLYAWPERGPRRCELLLPEGLKLCVLPFAGRAELPLLRAGAELLPPPLLPALALFPEAPFLGPLLLEPLLPELLLPELLFLEELPEALFPEALLPATLLPAELPRAELPLPREPLPCGRRLLPSPLARGGRLRCCGCD